MASQTGSVIPFIIKTARATYKAHNTRVGSTIVYLRIDSSREGPICCTPLKEG